MLLTDCARQIGCRQNKDIFAILELVQLRQQSVYDLMSKPGQSVRQCGHASRVELTLTASLGSFPLIAPALADVRLSTSSISTTTKQFSSSTSSSTLVNSLWTSLPDSLNHLLMMLCELISTSLPLVYLHGRLAIDRQKVIEGIYLTCRTV